MFFRGTNPTRSATAFVIITALCLLLSGYTRASAAPGDASGIPLADGEQTARACYDHAMGFWNSVMATKPTNQMYLKTSYTEFSKCAAVALTTGKTLPNGERLPWFVDYFASTVGATYAQLQLAALTRPPEQCSHVLLAHDLAQQVMETEGGFSQPQVQFEQDWQTLTDHLKDQALSCGAKGTAT